MDVQEALQGVPKTKYRSGSPQLPNQLQEMFGMRTLERSCTRMLEKAHGDAKEWHSDVEVERT
jgi:hypothetical protein